MFRKGQPRPPASGRKKGQKNAETIRRDQAVEEALKLLNETILDDIRTLSPRERVILWEKLHEYIRPKKQRVVYTDEEGNALPVVQFVLPDNGRDKYLDEPNEEPLKIIKGT